MLCRIYWLLFVKTPIPQLNEGDREGEEERSSERREGAALTTTTKQWIADIIWCFPIISTKKKNPEGRCWILCEFSPSIRFIQSAGCCQVWEGLWGEKNIWKLKHTNFDQREKAWIWKCKKYCLEASDWYENLKKRRQKIMDRPFKYVRNMSQK